MAESGVSQTKDKTSGFAWGYLANTDLLLLVFERKVFPGTGREEVRPLLVQLGTICQHEESRRLTHQQELELVQERGHTGKHLRSARNQWQPVIQLGEPAPGPPGA